MAELLAKLFIKDYQNTKNPSVRAAYGELSGAVGIVVNLILTAAKFFVGMMTGSISVSADAVNNLSDAGSSAITLDCIVFHFADGLRAFEIFCR